MIHHSCKHRVFPALAWFSGLLILPFLVFFQPETATAQGQSVVLLSFTGDSSGLLWHGMILLAVLPAFLWAILKPLSVNRINDPGFEILTTTEARTFIPLQEKFQQMDFLNRMDSMESMRLSANLNKVNLSFRRFGYLLEDKNFRNALLVNRRRVRRTMLRDCDVLDIGDLILLYRDLRQPAFTRTASITPPDGKTQIRFDRIRGPVRKGTPILISEQQQNRQFYITKNLVYLGRSEVNDLIIKARNVDYNHAKIERIGGRYKIIDLSNAGNTFVNNRRIEQKILRDGDEISIDNHRFKFQISTKAIRPASFNPPAQQDSQTGDGDDFIQEEDIQEAQEG